MPVLPEEITAESFRRRWRGYDRRQVDRFLARVAADYTGAIERIAHEASQLPESFARTRCEADAEATAAASAIRARAEQAAQALDRQAEMLRAQAQTDADTARARLEQADARASRLDHDSRQRWEALRAETEHHWERLLAADRQLSSRISQFEQTLARLRAKAALLDEITNIEDGLAAIRANAYSEVPQDHIDTTPGTRRSQANAGASADQILYRQNREVGIEDEAATTHGSYSPPGPCWPSA